MKIGIIDSGLGAIAIKDEFKIKDYKIIMDKAYFPYGKKSKTFLILRSVYLCEYLLLSCDEILLACNTLSIIALPFLKLRYKDKIRGVLDLLLPYSNSNTVFLGSSNTVKYLNMQYYMYPCLSCDNLIKAIENNENIEEEIKKVEFVIPKNSTLLLGCTHFIYVKDLFYHKVIYPKEKALK